MLVVQLHPVKTGGRGLNKYLQKNEFNVKYYVHHTLAEVIQKMGLERFKSYHSIVTTRNPYSRVFSLHRFYSRYPDWKLRNKYDILFGDFVRKYRNELHKICPPQVDYAVYDGVVLTSFIVKFENYANEVNYHFQAANKMQAVPQRAWQHAYTRKLQDIVYELYEGDFLTFGYKYSDCCV